MDDTLHAGAAFDDSEFEWDSATPRSSRALEPQPSRWMNRLAWAVLVLLTFCPPLGFALATLWH